ncbi:MAG: LiaF-related protein [Rectinema sp.]|nr:LiaF-related protein [Rectinema sp.]
MKEGKRSVDDPASSIDQIREKALDIATRAFADNKLSLEQYETKAAEIQNARTLAQIRDCMKGLVELEAFSPETEVRETLSPFGPKKELIQEKAPDLYFCIMGDRKVDGRSIRTTNAASITIMGSTIIDLRGIAIPDEGIHLDVIAVMGETKILVSPGMEVRCSVVPFMGEAVNKAMMHHGEYYQGTVVIGGIAFMGSVRVLTSS